jgi:hypothetical protein
MQFEKHPSPLRVLPSSQFSLPEMIPSPQIEATKIASAALASEMVGDPPSVATTSPVVS